MELGATMAEASLAEDGCSAYGFWQNPSDPTQVRVFEEWASEADLGTHFATPHMAAFMEGLGQLSISEMDLSKYEVSTKGPLM
jgi:quinol monooxygenase YgiN